MLQIINPDQFAGYTELKVVDNSNLEHLMQEGWVLLASFAVSETIEFRARLPYSVEDSMGYRVQAETVAPVVESQVRFLLGRTGKAASLYARVQKLEQENETHLKALKKREERIDELQLSFRRLQETKNMFKNDYEETRKQKCKMEADLGKLEEALGSLRMRKILKGDNDAGE